MTTDHEYEPPMLIELGSIRELTQANVLAAGQDGHFSFTTYEPGNGNGYGNGNGHGHHGS
jgi:hypothetical protein